LSLSSNVVSQITTTANITGSNIIATAAMSAASVSASANITGGNLITSAAISAASVSASGNITGGNVLGGANVNATLFTGTTISVTGNITGGNLIVSGILVDNTGNLDLQATATNANINLTPAGTGIVGISTSLSVTGNITGGNVLGGANVNATTHTGTTVSVTGNITGGNVLGGANVNATLFTGTTVSVAGNVTGGNLITAAAISAASVSASGTVTGSGFVATGATVITANVTNAGMELGLLNAVNTPYIDFHSSGNATADYDTRISSGGGGATGTGTLSLTGAVVTASAILSAIGNIVGGNLSGTSIVGTLTTAAQNNITSVGTLSSLAVTANVTGGNILTGGLISATGAITGAAITGSSLTVSTGNIAGGNINNNNTTGVGNIGTSTVAFNTVFAKATSAQYADLAEWYEADAEYPPGTVLIFGGSKEVTQAIGIGDVRVAGVVSTNPAHIMNSGLEAEHTAAVALTGRVPTMVVGAVRKGDMMVTAGGGRAQACAEPRMGAVIGKSLQDHPGGQGMIEIVVGRL